MENNFKKKQVRCIVCGGKTGGHLIPGIAIYEILKKKGVSVRYVLNSTDIKFPVVKRIEEADRLFLNISSISRKFSFKSIFYVFRLFFAFLKIFRKIASFKPNFVIITGGYISNPVALSSIFLFKPLYILEQNSVAGITNRFYSMFARKIFTSFEKTLKIPEKKAIYTRNPLLCFEKVEKKLARKFFELEEYEKVIGIISGSQGARNVNNVIIKILDRLDKENIGIIWSIGAVEFERLRYSGELEKIKKYSNLRFYPFIEKMNYFYSSIDIAISRAGATSISELLYFGVPSIFIPIKNSPDNHQELNARFLTDKNVAQIIPEDSLNEENLFSLVNKMLSNLKDYKKNFSLFNRSEKLPQELIVDEIIKLEGK